MTLYLPEETPFRMFKKRILRAHGARTSAQLELNEQEGKQILLCYELVPTSDQDKERLTYLRTILVISYSLALSLKLDSAQTNLLIFETFTQCFVLNVNITIFPKIFVKK